MTWDIFLMTASILMLFLMFGLGIAEHVALAETIAPHLAAEFGSEEVAMRAALRDVLWDLAVWRTAVNCIPLALLTLLLVARVITWCAGAFMDGWNVRSPKE